MIRSPIIKIFVAGLRITLSEFVRNEFLVKQDRINYYATLKLSYQTTAANGILWLARSIIFSYVLYEIQKGLGKKKALLLGWIVAFLMMRIVLYNLQVLPFHILLYAVPLSILEIHIALTLMEKKD